MIHFTIYFMIVTGGYWLFYTMTGGYWLVATSPTRWLPAASRPVTTSAVGPIVAVQCYRRLKTYIILTFWDEESIYLSGISPTKRSRSGPNSVNVDTSRGDNVQGIMGAIDPGKMMAGTSPAEPEYFVCGKPRDLSFGNFATATKLGHET